MWGHLGIWLGNCCKFVYETEDVDLVSEKILRCLFVVIVIWGCPYCLSCYSETTTMIVFCLSDVCFVFRLHAITKAESLFDTWFHNHCLSCSSQKNPTGLCYALNLQHVVLRIPGCTASSALSDRSRPDRGTGKSPRRPREVLCF